MEIITIRIDEGIGGYAWVKAEGSPSPNIGANIASLMPGDDISYVSDTLTADLRSWANVYMDSNPDSVLSERMIDWDRFNSLGIELATRLATELKGKFRVYYQYADDDPLYSHSSAFMPRI